MLSRTRQTGWPVRKASRIEQELRDGGGFAAGALYGFGLYRCLPRLGGGCTRTIVATHGTIVDPWTKRIGTAGSSMQSLLDLQGIMVVCVVRSTFAPWLNILIPRFGRMTETLSVGDITDATIL